MPIKKPKLQGLMTATDRDEFVRRMMRLIGSCISSGDEREIGARRPYLHYQWHYVANSTTESVRWQDPQLRFDFYVTQRYWPRSRRVLVPLEINVTRLAKLLGTADIRTWLYAKAPNHASILLFGKFQGVAVRVEILQPRERKRPKAKPKPRTKPNRRVIRLDE